jgi:integrase
MIRSLKALFNYGIKYYDLDIKNPVVGLDMFPIDINLKYIPSGEDILAVKALCAAKQNFLIDFVDQTGCRIMEAIRLKTEDIQDDKITLWTRKAKNSNLTPRTVPRPECFNGLDFKKNKGVFDDWETSIPRFLTERVKALGHKKWSWHNLRHRRASIWASQGMTTLEIMVRLGHSNLSTTMKYLQLLGFTRL